MADGGSGNANAIAIVKLPLATDKAISYLEREETFISVPPVRPKAGQIFLYKAPSLDKKGICK